jgi:hypothetical protein
MAMQAPFGIRLEEAHLCLDCDYIGDDCQTCVQCGSRAVYSVAKFVNRVKSASLVRVAHTCQDNQGIPCAACNRVAVT